MKEKKIDIRYHYLRNEARAPEACVAYWVDKENDAVTFGCATCNLAEDAFTKREARTRAKWRLYEESTVVACDDRMPREAVARWLAKHGTNHHLRRLARAYLRRMKAIRDYAAARTCEDCCGDCGCKSP